MAAYRENAIDRGCVGRGHGPAPEAELRRRLSLVGLGAALLLQIHSDGSATIQCPVCGSRGAALAPCGDNGLTFRCVNGCAFDPGRA